MKRARLWSIRPADAGLEQQMARELSLRLVTARVLRNRGIDTVEQGRSFLDAPISALGPAADLPDLDVAVERLLRAREQGEEIVVFGDYDVDGLSGACLLYHLLHAVGARVDVWIPDRLRHGYGLSAEGVRRMLERRPGVVVTVDHGVTAHEAVDVLQAAGIDVIVTDHHQKPARLPRARALLNPLLLDPDHPCFRLAGAGVAFKLACGLFQALPLLQRRQPRVRQVLREALGFAALGTVADVMPLQHENRLIVRHGLKMLEETRMPGLKALRDSAGLSGRVLEAEDISYSLAPRLNAAGRTGQVEVARRLLMTACSEEAERLARQLEELNRERRELEARVLEQARSKLADEPADDPVLVLWSETFHSGVIGIVAARLVEELDRPVFLVGLEGGTGRGSGRSRPGFDLAQALAAASPLMRSHGGHAAAAGFEIDPERLPELRAALVRNAHSHPPARCRGELFIDSEIQLHQVDQRLVEELRLLGPFGEGNPPPVFATRQVQHAHEPRRVGQDGNHLLLKLRYRSGAISAIGFGQGHRIAEAQHPQLALAFTPRSSTYPHGPATELLLLDLAAPDDPP